MALIDALLASPDAALTRLSGALRGGRLRLDSGEAWLRSYGWPSSWLEILRAAAAGGYTAGQLAELADAVRAARASSRRRTELVATRPEAGEARLLDTAVVVRQLFASAEREVLIAGFRVTERALLEPLRRPLHRALDVRLYLDLDPSHDALGRKQARTPSLIDWPSLFWAQFIAEVWPEELAAPRGYFAPTTLAPDAAGEWRSMHVKSVVVDRKTLFVTSANFTRRGHARNLELGLLVEDPQRAEECAAVFDAWTAAGVFVSFG